MEHTNVPQKNVDRTRENNKNINIYRYLKEEELSQLTDDEFEILQIKLLQPYFSTVPLTAAFHDYENGYNAKGLNGDETALNIYRRMNAANFDYFSCFYQYSQIFSLAHTLGVTDLYDIGCGSQLQGLFFMFTQDMRYTGIDPDIFEYYPDEFFADPAYINELFKQFAGSDRIRYIKDKYPLDLEIAENNIAVCMYTFGFWKIATSNVDNSAVGKIIARDFERIVFNIKNIEYNLTGMSAKDIVYSDVEVWVNPFEKYYELWKKALPDFEFYRIGEHNSILATKIPTDREKLQKKYTIIDDRILSGIIDTSWYTKLMIPHGIRNC